MTARTDTTGAVPVPVEPMLASLVFLVGCARSLIALGAALVETAVSDGTDPIHLEPPVLHRS